VILLEKFDVRSFDNVLQFHSSIKKDFPKISQIAFDILAIPGSSADCESIASIAKNIWTDRRSKMSPALLEAIVMEKVNHKVYNKIEDVGSLKNENEVPNETLKLNFFFQIFIVK